MSSVQNIHEHALTRRWWTTECSVDDLKRAWGIICEMAPRQVSGYDRMLVDPVRIERVVMGCCPTLHHYYYVREMICLWCDQNDVNGILVL